nr:RHS repeat-associated core domain-containing protein [Sporotomaculum syntrophicum]
MNRLTGVQRPGGEQLSYQYDSRGNRTVASPNDSGLNGFIPGDFSYNNWGQLAAFTTGCQTNNYYYDPEGLRTKKVTPSGTTRYHYDNTGKVIIESNAGDSVTAQMIWGNQALARKVNGSYYYYLYNGHGDVTRVIDQNGNIVNSYTYDEWGNILSQQEQVPQPLKYAGEYYDDESGLYYLRARYYDPTVGRFISRDSNEGSITNPLSLNLYVYCYSNPLNYLDPTGHSAKEVWQDLKLGVGAVLNGDNWQSSWAAVKTTPEGAIIYVREGLVGPENYDELTNEDLSWADAKAGASAAAFFVVGKAKVLKGAGKAKWDIKTNAKAEASYNFNGQKVRAYQDNTKEGYWWAKDTTGHGGSTYKVFKKKGNELHWVADADEYGNFIVNKHKSSTGTIIKLK